MSPFLHVLTIQQRSSTSGLQTGTGPQLVGNWAVQAAGENTKLHLHIPTTTTTGLWNQKDWGPLLYSKSHFSKHNAGTQ